MTILSILTNHCEERSHNAFGRSRAQLNADIGVLLHSPRLGQKAYRQRSHTSRSRKNDAARDAPGTIFEGSWQRVINGRLTVTVDNQSQIVEAKTRSHILAATIIHLEIEHVELLPRLALHPLIRITHLDATEMIDQGVTIVLIIDGGIRV